MSQRKWLYVCFCLYAVSNLHALEPLWMDRFMKERRLAFGAVRDHSTEETRKFLLIRDPSLTSSGAPQTVVVAPIEKPVNLPAKLVPTVKPIDTKEKTERPIATGELLTKSRKAYEIGELEDARRYYRLVLKADPKSTEAAERLQLIDKELN